MVFEKKSVKCKRHIYKQAMDFQSKILMFYQKSFYSFRLFLFESRFSSRVCVYFSVALNSRALDHIAYIE